MQSVFRAAALRRFGHRQRRAPRIRSVMKPWIKRMLGSLAVLAVFFVVCVWLLFSVNSPFNRAAALETTRSWARLAPFPASAKHIEVTTEGGPFSRGFRVSFEATAEDIAKWLQESTGTRQATVTIVAPGVRYFSITPGEGAQHAEVTVRDVEHRVLIYVYWS